MPQKADNMDRVGHALTSIARSEGVRIVYACEGGSRAWGFASADSDYDVRFIYARPVEFYLQLNPPRDVIEASLDGDLDIVGWDVLKACRLGMKSNPHLFEWLGSPIVYAENGAFAQCLRDEIHEHFSPRACCEHYLSMARHNHKVHINGRTTVIRKKYLYVLRPITCAIWLLDRGTFSPTTFSDVLKGIELPQDVTEEIAALVDDKRRNQELGESPASPVLNAFVVAQVDDLEDRVKNAPSSRFPVDRLNTLIKAALLGKPDDECRPTPYPG